jgi:hypothetical protein
MDLPLGELWIELLLFIKLVNGAFLEMKLSSSYSFDSSSTIGLTSLKKCMDVLFIHFGGDDVLILLSNLRPELYKLPILKGEPLFENFLETLSNLSSTINASLVGIRLSFEVLSNDKVWRHSNVLTSKN